MTSVTIYTQSTDPVTFNPYDGSCTFIDTPGFRIVANIAYARKLWAALDAHFANEGNVKPMLHDGHYEGCACDGSLVDSDGTTVPFVADHVYAVRTLELEGAK